MNSFGYNVCFLDILGFSEKICREGGLESIKSKYIQLTDSVRAINNHYRDIISKGIYEGSYHVDSGIRVFYKTNVLYGSDSIIIWSDRTWEAFKNVKNPQEMHIASKWTSFPKPCDPFIEVCKEIICKSIELDLPLRGALSTGKGFFDFEKYIFIGKPIVEAVKLEKLQNIIGASFCLSFENQIIPKRFYLKMEDYLKTKVDHVDYASITNQNLLDWPRYWRNTRQKELDLAIQELDFGPRDDIRDNTKRFINLSKEYQNNYISPDEKNIQLVYKDIYEYCDLPMLLWNGDRFAYYG